jgi:hypothetical protein
MAAAVNMTSVRLQILNAMVAAFKGILADKPDADPYGIAFSTVGLGPLADYDQRKRYSLGIVPGPERETLTMPYITCFLTVNVEFRVTVNRDDHAPGVLIEELLTVVKRKLTEDRTWGGLAIDTKAIGSEIDLITYADRSAVGVCVAEVQYRHSHLDLRDPKPNF